MRKPLRIAIAIVGALFVLVVAVRLLVPAEKWRELALDQFEKHTGMKATAGTASVQFPWPVGLKLAGVQLTDEREDGAYERLHVTVEEVVVSAQLRSLLQRKPRVNEIRLVKPRVELALRAQEPTPEEITRRGDSSTAESTPASVPEGMVAVLSLLAIEDGEVHLQRGEAGDIHLVGLDQRFSLRVEEDGHATGVLTAVLGGGQFHDPGRPDPLELPPLELEVGLDGNLQDRVGSLQVERLVMGGVEFRGPVQWDLSRTPADLEATLDVHADLTTVHERFGSLAATPESLNEPPRVFAGQLEGKIRYAGSLPADGLDPAALLSGVSGEGEIADVRVSVLGQDDVRARTTWRLQDSMIRLDAIEFTARGTHVTGEVSMPATGGGAMVGELQLDLDLEKLRALVLDVLPQLPAEKTESLPAVDLWPVTSGKISADLELNLPLGQELDPERRPVVCTARPSAVSVRLAGFTESFAISGGTVVATLLEADVSGLEVVGPGVQGVFEAHLEGWPETVVCDLEATLARLDVDALQAALPAPKETAWIESFLPRPAHADESDTGETRPPENLTVRFVAQASEVKTKGYTLSDVRTQGTLAEQRLQVPSLEGKMGSGSLKGTAQVDWTTDPPRWEADTEAESLPAGELLAPFAGVLAGALSTEVSGTMTFRGPLGAEPEVVRTELDGAGAIHTTAGRLLTEPVLGTSIPQFLGSQAQSFKSLDFRRIATGIRVDEGRIQFDDLLLDGPTSVAAQGWVGLTGRCDYRLQIKLPPDATPDLGAITPLADFLRDEDRRITFGVAVSGPAEKPKIQIDRQDLEGRAQQAAAAAARGELDRLVGDALEGAGTDSTGVDLEDLKDQAEDALDGLLKGFGGKKDKGGQGGG